MRIEPYTYNPGKVCTRCIMDSTVKGIQFDIEGVCSFCHMHDEMENKFALNQENADKLNKLIDKIKKEGKGKQYDCILGVSGGRDSTYTLYSAVKLGLRPLAVHFDNGWNSEIAVQNIKRATEILGVDLHTHVADWEEFKDLQRAFLLASVPDAEVPTDWVIFSVLFREAVVNNVKYIIQGHSFRTEGTTPLSWTYMDGRYVNDVHRRFGTKKLKSFPIMGMIKFLYYSIFKRIKQVRILYFIPYNEKEVFDLLHNEVDWRNYGDKHHESKYTAFFQSYILMRKFKIDKRRLHLSAKIRNGQISRDEALAIIETDPFTGGKQLLDYCLKKLELSSKEFESIMATPIRSFKDFNSYYGLIKWLKIPMKIGNRFGLVPDSVVNKYFSLEASE